jgi:hypothetical protein
MVFFLLKCTNWLPSIVCDILICAFGYFWRLSSRGVFFGKLFPMLANFCKRLVSIIIGDGNPHIIEDRIASVA